jgi:hypothetical protein
MVRNDDMSCKFNVVEMYVNQNYMYKKRGYESVHSFRSLSYDRSRASSKPSSLESTI